MGFEGSSGGDFARDIGIRVGGDTRGLQKAAADGQKSLGALAAEANKAGKAVGDMGKAAATGLAEARKQATAFSTAMKDGVGITGVKAFGALAKEVQAASKPMDGLTKNITALATKFGLLGGAINITKQYFEDLFSRSKTDPALAAVNRLRQTTEEWIKSFRAGVDSVVVATIGGIEAIADKLGQLTYGVTGETDTARGMIDTNATENARRQWKAMGRPFVSRMEAHYTGKTATEDLLDFRTIEGGFRGQGARRVVAGTQQQIEAVGGLGFGFLQRQGEAYELSHPSGRGGGGGPGVFGPGTGRVLGAFAQPWRQTSALIGLGSSYVGRGGFAQMSDQFDTSGIAAMAGGEELNAFRSGGLMGAFGGGQQPRGPFAGMFQQGKGEFADWKKLNDMKSAVTDSLGSMADALGASVAASLAAGDMSVKQAFRVAAAEMKALAIKSGVMALYAGVQALFNPLKATEAAGYAATAAAAGAAAALLGGMGGSGGGTPQGAAPGGMGAGGGSYGGGRGGGQYYVPGGIDGAHPQTVNVYVTAGMIADKQQVGVAVQDALHQTRMTGRTRPQGSAVVRYE